jgi:uncharacterized protein
MSKRISLQIAGFVAFSHGWTWLFWSIAGLSGQSVWDSPGVFFFYIGGAGVFLGGVLMSWAAGGRPGLKDLAQRIFDPRLISARWWLLILLFFPALNLLAAALAGLLGLSAQPLDLSETRLLLANPAQFFGFAFFVLLIGPLPEEIGWRGYLLDRLQVRWNALAASLILAVIWTSWHLPLFYLPGYFDPFGGAPPGLLPMFYGILSVVVIYTWVYNNTHRSVLAVILFHFLQNLSGELLALSEEAKTVRLLLTAAVSFLVLLYAGERTPRRADRGRPLPLDRTADTRP